MDWIDWSALIFLAALFLGAIWFIAFSHKERGDYVSSPEHEARRADYIWSERDKTTK